MTELLFYNSFSLTMPHQATQNRYWISRVTLYLRRLLVTFVPQTSDDFVQFLFLLALNLLLIVGPSEVILNFGLEVRQNLQGVQRFPPGLHYILTLSVNLLVDFIHTVFVQFLRCFLVDNLVFCTLGLGKGLLGHFEDFPVYVLMSLGFEVFVVQFL
jgi:hypothetical protein